MGDGMALDPHGFAAVAGLLLAASLLGIAARPRWVTSRPLPVLLALGLVSALAALSLFRLDPPGVRLSIDPSTEPLLPVGDPGRELYRSATLDFGDDQLYAVVLECGEVFTPGCLATIRSVSDRIARLDGVRSVTSLLDVTSFRYVPEEDWIEVRPFIETIPGDERELALLRARALADPVYRRTLVSDDASAAAINVRFRDWSDAERIAADLDGQIAAILSEHAQAGRRFYVSGRPHFKARIYRGMVRDLGVLIPVAIVAIGAMLTLFHGSLRGVLLPLGTGLGGVLWTFGAMAALGRPLSLLTVLVGPTLLAIGSVYGLHVLSRYDEDARAANGSAEAALRCLEHVRMPALIAGLTTVVGFGALLTSDIPAVFELGAFSVLGVAALTVLALAGVPAVLALLPLRSETARPPWLAVVDGLLGSGLRAVARLAQRGARPILVGFGLLGLLAAALVPSIVVDTDSLSYFDERDPVRLDFDAVNRKLSGVVPLYVVIEGGADGALRDPTLLRGLEHLQQRIEAIPGVGRTLSFLDPLRTLNRAFHEDRADEQRIPDTREAVTELLFLIPKTDLGAHATVNHERANLVARTGEVGSAAVRRLVAEIEAVIERNPLPGHPVVRVTGNAYLLARSADGIARSQPRSIGLAAIAIFLLMATSLRSLSLGAVAMVPNLLPVLLFFGLLGAGAATLSLPTSLIGCIALGIAIDDSVHFIVRYQRERRGGASPEQAARRCAHSVGRPIVITTLMLAAGFLVIAFSEFATLREFGVLTAVTMGLCLATDLLLLPALLLRLRV